MLISFRFDIASIALKGNRVQTVLINTHKTKIFTSILFFKILFGTMKLFALAILTVLPSGAYSNDVSITRILQSPLNDQCSNAISVNPFTDKVVMGNFTGVSDYRLWYKFKNVEQRELGIVVSTLLTNGNCTEFAMYSPAIRVYKGVCRNLIPVGGDYERAFSPNCIDPNEFGFLPSALSTYYIEVIGNSKPPADTFALSFSNFSTVPPPNDNCDNAFVIPSAPTFPYLTKEVNIGNATRSLTDTNLSCTYFHENLERSIWYEWSPEVTGRYQFIDRKTYQSLYIGIFLGDACGKAKEISCQSWGDYTPVLLERGKKYSIQIKIFDFSSFNYVPFVLRVEPLPNDECINAISLNPRTAEVTGDTTYASYDTRALYSARCLIPDAATIGYNPQGIWYKIKNVLNTTLSILASVCKSGTFCVHQVSVYQGNNCKKIKCVGRKYGNNDAGTTSKSVFLALPATTSYIYVSQPYQSISPGKFTLTIDGSPSFLSLINPQTDTFIAPVGDDLDFEYFTFPTSKLNIQATFDPDIPVSSVRLTFDNPTRNFCDNKAPYSMFGDNKGDFYNATIPVGSHLATATPYGLPGCRGPPGNPVAKKFTVNSCDFVFTAYDTGREWEATYFGRCTLGSSYGYIRQNLLSFNTSAFPCKVNVQARIQCGFDIQFVRMTLRDAVTKKVVHESTTNGTGPFFLFGTQIVRSNPIATYAPSNYSIAPGSYTLTADVDGIQLPSTNLFISSKVRCTDCATRRCGCLDGVLT
jgi:hypothetical protein